MPKKISAIIISFCFIFQHAGFAQISPDPGISAYPADFTSIPGRFRPVQLRSVAIDPLDNVYSLLIDTGDEKDVAKSGVSGIAGELLRYFKIGLALPDSMFWVNLRPDSPDSVIDPHLARTDIGKIMLEADLMLKKDLAGLTDPGTAQGREYWNKLYSKAEDIFKSEDAEIPSLTRPWIVPGEIILRETPTGAYIYKASLKVCLEQDHIKDSPFYRFDDPRLKELNDYSSGLIRELIIPRLTREVNSSKRYAPLRQVYYSLVLAQWFKQKTLKSNDPPAIKTDDKDLTGLASASRWDPGDYYKAYKRSFQNGEYNKIEPRRGPDGPIVCQYFSGGMVFNEGAMRGSLHIIKAKSGDMPQGLYDGLLSLEIRNGPSEKNGPPADRAKDGGDNVLKDIYENGLTLDKYRGLTEGQKRKLRERFFEVFEPRNGRRVYPLYKEDKVLALTEASRELLKKYPDEQIAGLGRSPLWFIEGSKIIEMMESGGAEAYRAAGDRYKYVAFSGKPFGSFPWANREQIADYHRYLINSGFDPASIVKRNEKTVIVEYVLTAGTGLSSFLNILLDLAAKQGVPAEQLKAKIILHILQEDILRNTAPKFKDKQGFSAVNYQYVDKELMEVLSDSDEFKDSLGVRFPSAQWGIIDPIKEKPAQNAPLVSFRIMDHLARDGGKGGIDFRGMVSGPDNASGKTAGEKASFGTEDLSAVVDLEAEWTEIRATSAVRIPYDRIMRYWAVCCVRQGTDIHKKNVLHYIRRILSSDEERAAETAAELKELLDRVG